MQIDLGASPPRSTYCQGCIYDQNNHAILLHPFRTTGFTMMLKLMSAVWDTLENKSGLTEN